MNTFVVILSAFFAIATETRGADVGQVTALFSELDQGGESITLPADVSDLARVGFDNRAKSVCVTGIWMYYTKTSYNPFGTGDLNFIFGTNLNCTNLKSPVRGAVSSVRLAGNSEDYRISTLTTYEFNTFQGSMLDRFSKDAPEIDTEYKAASIIITGDDCWTIYERENYGGKKICIEPPEKGSYKPSFIADTTSLQAKGFDSETIGSVRKGCYCG